MDRRGIFQDMTEIYTANTGWSISNRTSNLSNDPYFTTPVGHTTLQDLTEPSYSFELVSSQSLLLGIMMTIRLGPAGNDLLN